MGRSGATAVGCAMPVSNRTYLRTALVGGGIAAIAMAGIVLTVGTVSGYEATRLLESALPTVRFLASSVMTAAATTLALLLTLLSLGGTTDQDLDEAFYHRVRLAARLDVVAFTAATILLVAVVVPFGEGGAMDATAMTILYYVFAIGAALVAGILVAVVLVLYQTVDALIETLWLDGDTLAAADAVEDEADAVD